MLVQNVACDSSAMESFWVKLWFVWLALPVARAGRWRFRESVDEVAPVDEDLGQVPKTSPCACVPGPDMSVALDCTQGGHSILLFVSSHPTCGTRTEKIILSFNELNALPALQESDIVEVIASNNHLTKLPSSPPLHEKTTHLDLSFNKITNNGGWELRNMTWLRTLMLSGNLLQSLDILPFPCKLKFLYADNNDLENVRGTLNGCHKLQLLQLSNNPLRRLPSQAFFGLRNLEKLLLSSVALGAVSKEMFDGLDGLEHLDLSHNLLSTIPSLAFSSLKALEWLDLHRNDISSLDPDAFRGLKNVSMLTLSNNKLETLPLSLFDDLGNLRYLVLNNNQIKDLPRGIFSHLKKMKGIALSSNKLTTLPPDAFLGMRTLKYIYLNDNKLERLPSDLLLWIRHLERLDLKHNRLSYFPPQFFLFVNSIKVLDISYNEFADIDDEELFDLQRIDRLELGHNNFTSIPEYAESWPSVKITNMLGNNINEASEGALRSWLSKGDVMRVLMLPTNISIDVARSLKWLVLNQRFNVAVTDNCACGKLSFGRAHVHFCVRMLCPAKYLTWIQLVTEGETFGDQDPYFPL